MPDDKVIPLFDAPVINRLRSKSVSYSVKLTHLVIDGEWNMGVEVIDIAEMDNENRMRIADDLEHAADMIRRSEHWESTT